MYLQGMGLGEDLATALVPGRPESFDQRLFESRCEIYRERSPRNCGVVGQHKDAHLFTGRENFADRLMKGGVGSITESGESSAERRGTSSNVENFVPATQSVKSARSGRQPSPPGCLVRTVLRPRPAIFQKDAFSKPVPINVLRL